MSNNAQALFDDFKVLSKSLCKGYDVCDEQECGCRAVAVAEAIRYKEPQASTLLEEAVMKYLINQLGMITESPVPTDLHNPGIHFMETAEKSLYAISILFQYLADHPKALSSIAKRHITQVVFRRWNAIVEWMIFLIDLYSWGVSNEDMTKLVRSCCTLVLNLVELYYPESSNMFFLSPRVVDLVMEMVTFSADSDYPIPEIPNKQCLTLAVLHAYLRAKSVTEFMQRDPDIRFSFSTTIITYLNGMNERATGIHDFYDMDDHEPYEVLLVQLAQAYRITSTIFLDPKGVLASNDVETLWLTFSANLTEGSTLEKSLCAMLAIFSMMIHLPCDPTALSITKSLPPETRWRYFQLIVTTIRIILRLSTRDRFSADAETIYWAGPLSLSSQSGDSGQVFLDAFMLLLKCYAFIESLQKESLTPILEDILFECLSIIATSAFYITPDVRVSLFGESSHAQPVVEKLKDGLKRVTGMSPRAKDAWERLEALAHLRLRTSKTLDSRLFCDNAGHRTKDTATSCRDDTIGPDCERHSGTICVCGFVRYCSGECEAEDKTAHASECGAMISRAGSLQGESASSTLSRRDQSPDMYQQVWRPFWHDFLVATQILFEDYSERIHSNIEERSLQNNCATIPVIDTTTSPISMAIYTVNEYISAGRHVSDIWQPRIEGYLHQAEESVHKKGGPMIQMVEGVFMWGSRKIRTFIKLTRICSERPEYTIVGGFARIPEREIWSKGICTGGLPTELETISDEP